MYLLIIDLQNSKGDFSSDSFNLTRLTCPSGPVITRHPVYVQSRMLVGKSPQVLAYMQVRVANAVKCKRNVTSRGI